MDMWPYHWGRQWHVPSLNYFPKEFALGTTVFVRFVKNPNLSLSTKRKHAGPLTITLSLR